MQRLQQSFNGVDEAIVFAFIPPPIDGLGNAGGFQMEVEDVGNVGYQALQSAAERLVVEGREQPGLQGLNSTFRASSPQLFVDIDRVQVKAKDVPLSSVFSTLQACLGSAYVNDFNSGGRTYQVRIQADAQFRAQQQDILDLEVRNRSGDAIPMGSLISIEEDFGPSVIRRYQMYPSASVNGSAAPGHEFGTSAGNHGKAGGSRHCPFLSAANGPGCPTRKNRRAGKRMIFLLAILAVFLVLAAQYESWTMPAAVIAVVPLAALGVVGALLLRGADNNVYTQIGIVLLVALASKNAILIVEFANEKRRDGLSIQDAATEAAWLRFRAILMTAFSSILGFHAAAGGQRSRSRQSPGRR